MNIKNIIIQVPEETHRQLRQYALDNKTNVRVIVTALIVKFLGDVAKKGKK